MTLKLCFSAWLVLMVSRSAHAVDLLMTPPILRVFETQTITVSCIVTGEYQATYHTIHLVHLTKGQTIYVTNDVTVSRDLATSRRNRYSVQKKTFGSGANQGWEFELTILKATNVDSGRYQCVRSEKSSQNKQFSTGYSHVFVEKIVPASSIAPQCALSPANPKPGQAATFSCFSIGEAPKLSLTWTKGDIKLPTRASNSTGQFNVVTFQRTITDSDNNGTFTCTASGLALGKESRACSLVPFFIPTNVTVTSIQTVRTGNPAEFICLATAVPRANKYTWVVSKGSRRHVVDVSRGRYVIEQGGALLRIKSVLPSDNNSSVQCVANNDLDIKGMNTGSLYTVPHTESTGGGKGINNRHAVGDGNFVFYGGGRGSKLTPHPGLLTPNNGHHDKNVIKRGRPNVPLLVGGSVGFMVFMSLVVFLLAVVMRSRSKRQEQVKKTKYHARPTSVISIVDIEKADAALVKGHTLSRSHTLRKSMAPKKPSPAALPSAISRKSVLNPDVSRQQLADKLAATLRTKSYVSLLSTPLPGRPGDEELVIEDDCVSRVSTVGTCNDSAYDELTCSMGSTVIGSRSNSNAGGQSCYGSMGSLSANTVKYDCTKERVHGLKPLDPSLLYAELDWSGRKPPSGHILVGDEKTLYAQIRKK